tara:strand:- start:288 stop:458 length:171 start_codon:yes stop_codon:yes gene_type:complete
VEIFASEYNYKSMDFGPLKEDVIRSKPQSTQDDVSKNEISSNEELEHHPNVFDHYA